MVISTSATDHRHNKNIADQINRTRCLQACSRQTTSKKPTALFRTCRSFRNSWKKWLQNKSTATLIRTTYATHFNRQTAAATRRRRRSCESRMTSARHWTENAEDCSHGAWFVKRNRYNRPRFLDDSTGTLIWHHRLGACVAAVVHQRTLPESSLGLIVH